MPFVTTRDGTRLFCRRWGDGPPIVFLAGWAMNSEAWQSAMTLVAAAGFEAIAYDRRSSGRSDDPGRGYDYDTLADDLGDVLAALGVSGATMVGHSMGNGEVVRYLTRHGAARVERMVMAAPSLPFALKSPDNPDGPSDPVRVAEMQAIWATNWVEWLGQAVPGAYGADTSPDLVQHSARMMMQTPPWAAIKLNSTVVGTDFREELRHIATAALVLHGDADRSMPVEVTGARLPALMPNCRLKVYPGADHTFIGASARQIVEDTLGFIAETGETARAA
jgi:pimeloyl-ACP methyl ester carboxylesterase